MGISNLKQMKYKEECNFFHSFYTDKSAAGLSFADENEAKNFLRCVMQYINQAQIPRSMKTTSILSEPNTIILSSQSNKDAKKKKDKNKKKDSKSRENGKKKKGTIDKSLIDILYIWEQKVLATFQNQIMLSLKKHSKL